MGLSENSSQIIKSAKSAKDALEKAEKAGIADKIREIYGKLDMSKNKGGFINP